jgi:hypothetical protein
MNDKLGRGVRKRAPDIFLIMNIIPEFVWKE